VNGGQVWLVVGKRSPSDDRTRYYLQAAYTCDAHARAADKRGDDVIVLSGPEQAYFEPGIALNDQQWWPDVSSSNFQGGVVEVTNSEAIDWFLDQLRTARSGSVVPLAEDLIGTSESNVEWAELESVGSEEGQRRLVSHYRYERDRALARKKIATALRQFRKVECECCGFNFQQAYGEFGKDFGEVHHTLPLSRYEGAAKLTTSLEDLAIVCSNCHRVLHWNEELTVAELRARLNTRAAGRRRLVKLS
jgi:hypothetical protein